MAKILLINPSWGSVYKNPVHSITAAFFPSLTLAMVAAQAKNKGNKIEILDLSFKSYDLNSVISYCRERSPDIVGFTATTALFPQVIQLSTGIKKLSKSIFTIGGGAHCSSLPERSIEEANLDAVCIGEGDFTLAEIASGVPLKDILGLAYKDSNGAININSPRNWVEDLDTLAMPAWDLFDLKVYRPLTSRLMVKRPPGGYFETTRGCVYKCNYCANITIQGNKLRKKSVSRVIEEIKYMKSYGFNELFLTDNLFTTDVGRAKEICRRIINEEINISWQCHSGIRVDAGDQEMFDLMHKAGCYKVAFGFETGSDEILRGFGKGGGASVSRAFDVATMARKAKIDVLGYFMVGLLNDTEETMRQTVEFGRKIPMDLVKISYCTPFPGTPIFKELYEKRCLSIDNWECYNAYRLQDFFKHPTLDSAVVDKYYKLAYKRMIYTNPRFILRRFIRAIRKNELIYEIYYFIKFFFSGLRI